MPGRLPPVQDVFQSLSSSLMLYMYVSSSMSANWEPMLLGRKSPSQRKSDAPSTQGTKGSGLLEPCLGVSLGRKQPLGSFLGHSDRRAGPRWHLCQGHSSTELTGHTERDSVLENEQIFFFSLPSEKLCDLKRPSQFTRHQVAQVTKVTTHTKEQLLPAVMQRQPRLPQGRSFVSCVAC